MGNPSTIFMLHSIITLALVLVAATAAFPSTTTAEITHSQLDRWFENLSHRKAAAATVTKLHIYIHADFNTHSPNETVYQIASAEITPRSAATFGRILVIDNPLTTGPDPRSPGLGHYQGLNAYSDFNEAAANMHMNIIFSGGEHGGSTLSILGRQPVFEEVRVLSVIGGTGAFRFARGTLLASTYSTDPLTQTGVYEYRIYVVTPSVEPVQTA